MTVTVAIDLGYEFAVKAPFDEVFALLSDVPKSASHFPKVHKLVDIGNDSYRWEMEKVGTQQVNIQTVYASHYKSQRDAGGRKGTVTWTPVKGEGNALVGGSWKIVGKKDRTELQFKVDGTVDVPLPGLMKMVVAPVVKGEFEKLVEKYIENLVDAFGGEVA